MATISKVSYDIVMHDINNENTEEGLFLPAIQREFVWNESQIYKLFDSIMRRYPVGTLLVWKTQSEIQHRKFITNFKQDLDYDDFNVEHKKGQYRSYVLDGQQRLQSLLLGISGQYEGKYLYFKLSDIEEDPDDEYLYDFKFISKTHAKWPWVKFSELLNINPFEAVRELQAKGLVPQDISHHESNVVYKLVSNAQFIFKSEKIISYELVRGIDLKKEEEDILNIFTRANSGGVVLDRTELLFSVIKAFWSAAHEELHTLVNTLNQDGFSFDKDFVLRSALVVLNRGAQYKIDKFRDQEFQIELQQKWTFIANAIKEVKDFVHDKTYIKSAKALVTDAPLIPLIYFRYHYPDKWKKARPVCRDFIIRALISGAFSGSTDKIIDEIVTAIKYHQGFNVEAIDNACEKNGRGLSVTRERILSEGYGSKSIHLIFNLLYDNINYKPAFRGNSPQIDHIFPKSKLASLRENYTDDTGKSRTKVKYSPAVRNQIANCMLLSMTDNQPGIAGKGTRLPEDWFADKSGQYLDLHLIPHDKNLWELKNFEKFIEARKELLIENLKQFLKIEGVE